MELAAAIEERGHSGRRRAVASACSLLVLGVALAAYLIGDRLGQRVEPASATPLQTAALPAVGSLPTLVRAAPIPALKLPPPPKPLPVAAPQRVYVAPAPRSAPTPRAQPEEAVIVVKRG